jgi:hypothetical protein
MMNAKTKICGYQSEGLQQDLLRRIVLFWSDGVQPGGPSAPIASLKVEQMLGMPTFRWDGL